MEPSERLYLHFYAPSAIFYFADLTQVREEFDEPFIDFYEELIDKLNFLGGSYNPATGEGRFPFHQTMLLRNIPAAQVLTGIALDAVVEFDITVQDVRHNFFVSGINMRTYQDVIDQVQANCPTVEIEYYPATSFHDHGVMIRSSVESQVIQNENGGTISAIISRLTVDQFFGLDVGEENVRSTTVDGSKATFNLRLPTFDGYSVLTLVPDNDDAVFEFKQGQERRLSISGANAQTYGDLADSINDNFSSVSARYRTTVGNKNEIILFFRIPDTAMGFVVDDEGAYVITNGTIEERPVPVAATEFDYIGAGGANQPVITNFKPLTANNNQILHVLGTVFAGGSTLLNVLNFTLRRSGEPWANIFTIENTGTNTSDVSSEDTDQEPIEDALDDALAASDPEEAADVADAAPSTELIVREQIDTNPTSEFSNRRTSEPKTSFAAGIIGGIGNFVSGFIGRRPDDDDNPTNFLEVNVALLAETIEDTGVRGIDANGNITDETLLTDAERAQLLEEPEIFSN